MNMPGPDLCSGCSACYSICPHRAIRMISDAEGFSQPEIDAGKCVRCGLCERVCPVWTRADSRSPLAVYAVKAKDDALRHVSSSGGVFTLLARKVIEEGGLVLGAGWERSGVFPKVVHCAAENETELRNLRGSKYVQSGLGDSFSSVKKALEAGRKVLFCGTPCQVAGVRNYLRFFPGVNGSVEKNLILLDFICHAVPSPKVFQRYLEELNMRLPITDIFFRDKTYGWKKYSFCVQWEKGNLLREPLDKNIFLLLFQNDLCNRRSCENCALRGLRSGSDLTLGDYWNAHLAFPDFDDDLGICAVLVNSRKGNALFESVKDASHIRSGDYDFLKRYNSSLVLNPVMHRKRGFFFERLNAGDSLPELWKKCGKNDLRPFPVRFLSKLKHLVKK